MRASGIDPVFLFDGRDIGVRMKTLAAFVIVVIASLLICAFWCIQLTRGHRPESNSIAIDRSLESPALSNASQPSSDPIIREMQIGKSAATAKSPTICVHVCASDKSPIADAALSYVTASKRYIEIGTSDQSGSFIMDVAAPVAASAKWLGVERSGFASQTIVLPDKLESDIYVSLEKEAVIAGRVVLSNGVAAGKDITVACWPRGAEPVSYETARESLVTRTSTRTTKTDEEGQFTVSQLHPDVYYSIGVGGRGLAAEDVVCGIKSGTRDLEIAVFQLHANCLSFVGSDDAPLKLFCDGAIWPWFRSWGPHGTQVGGSLTTVALADDGGELSQLLDRPECYVQLWETAHYGQVIGGIRVDCHLSGFRRIEETYSAAPIQQGVSKYKFKMVSEGLETGEIGFRFTRGGVPVESGGVVDALAPTCELRLSAPDGHDLTANLPNPNVEGVRVVSGVPVGQRDLFVRDTGTGFRSPVQGLTSAGVNRSGMVIIDVPIDSVGAIDVDYERRFSVSWGETPALVLGTIGPGIVKDGKHGVLAKGIVRLPPGGSRVPGVPAGDYQVFPFEISRGDSNGQDIGQLVRVVGGEATHLWLPMTWP